MYIYLWEEASCHPSDTTSVYRVGVARKKRKNIPQVTIFVPSVRVPLQSHLQNLLLPNHLAHRLASLRNQIVFFTQLTDGSAIPELHASLQEYLSLLVGLTHNHKERGLEQLVEFKWKNLEDGLQEVCVANSWFELLSVVHMMAMLTLTEANAVLTHNQTSSRESLVTADSMRSGIVLLLKAAGHLEFSIRDILVRIPPDIKIRLPQDLQEGVLEATSFQALGQGTEMQLALAVESKNATLSVKRRLACEQLTYFSQAHYCLSTCNNNNGYGKKHLLFIKWKYLEAKAAAYYFHGLITDKGTESSSHISAVCCFLAAEELLTESKKACLSFCLAVPVTRAPPPWGAMKYLNRKIPETASRKCQMYGYLLEEKKDLGILPELPEFQLSLKADDYQLPEMDSEWNNKHLEIPSRTLEEPLGDSEDEMEPK